MHPSGVKVLFLRLLLLCLLLLSCYKALIFSSFMVLCVTDEQSDSMQLCEVWHPGKQGGFQRYSGISCKCLRFLSRATPPGHAAEVLLELKSRDLQEIQAASAQDSAASWRVRAASSGFMWVIRKHSRQRDACIMQRAASSVYHVHMKQSYCWLSGRFIPYYWVLESYSGHLVQCSKYCTREALHVYNSRQNNRSHVIIYVGQVCDCLSVVQYLCLLIQSPSQVNTVSSSHSCASHTNDYSLITS